MCNADVNVLPEWLGKEYDAKGGRPLPGMWALVVLLRQGSPSSMGRASEVSPGHRNSWKKCLLWHVCV
jgi:hypothetical protein